MDIIEFAMKMELDGKAFYNKHARESKDDDLKRIFSLLADEEQRHYNYFKSLKEDDSKTAIAQLLGSSDTLAEVKNIFVTMSENSKVKHFSDKEVDTWKEALEIEEKAESFYREKSKEESDDDRKKMLNLIADEERNHVHMIETILYYLRFPDAFEDSSQYKNFQSLEGH